MLTIATLSPQTHYTTIFNILDITQESTQIRPYDYKNLSRIFIYNKLLKWGNINISHLPHPKNCKFQTRDNFYAVYIRKHI